MKYKYTYNRNTKEYQVERDGIKSAWFKSLRDCKISWKILKTMEIIVI